ncbi:Uma2 family endonuclease [Leptolyngbya sp. FACHB-711]|uniref:Uma2 family endonuclease n=1 Tax=Leptolyngbya sp. FACHB-711 TaxID=2692813 RepID=UPI001688D2D6|nr:Uma2 family endonuclease [Leptolyngbya sp. FACHB-711]MBD2023803.1 Uma2 family endonuclease [Leptolyngbya sp. FACHB-711]
MTQAVVRPRVSFEEYVDICAQTDERYELVQGELHRMNPPTMLHYRIAKFLERILDQAIEAHLDPEEWETVREPGQRTEVASSRLPDVAIVSRAEAERLLHQTAVFQTPSLLVVEIVSPSSASEDYDRKLKEYEALGVQEYWVIDYEGLGAAKYIGFPKSPTLTIYALVNGKYEAQQFRDDEPIESAVFGRLDLTAEQVFTAKK